MLKLKNITKNYYVGPLVVEALKGVSIEFRKNEFVAILGPSGCGKTTLLNIIGGLDRYTSGDLLVNNRSTKDFKDDDWDSYRNYSIGFVFQNYNLISHISVLRNVELALTLSGVSVGERRERALKALSDVGLSDQVHKRPNQLSGGQMQRVAIARALVNNPDVLLADEPTGALDTETSRQIMEILKSISQERLIIMVTHNPTIANQYSTRIVKLLDGLVVGDSNPYQQEEAKEIKKAHKDKTSMSFLTALSLSLGNLITKKARTILTAFAGSIGIIGIALVLSLSNGFQRYVDKMQADTLASYPLTISETAIDFSQIININRGTDLEEFPDTSIIHVNALRENLNNAIIENDINDQYINDVIKKIDPNLYNGITYSYGVEMNIFRKMPFGADFYYPEIYTGDNQPPFTQWNELIETENATNPFSFVQTQYDVLEGHMPESKNEIVLVVDSYNQITDLTLINLGFFDIDSSSKFTFADFIGYQAKLILNNGLYTFDGTKFTKNYQQVSESTMLNPGIYDSENAIDIEIVGIIRVNTDTPTGSVSGAFGYTKALTDFLLADALTSDIVMWMNTTGHETLNPFTGNAYIAGESTVAELRLETMRELGGVATPSEIKIFPVDFDAKQDIKTYLDQENDQRSELAILSYYENLGISESEATEVQKKAANAVGQKAGVYYVDLMDTLVSSINTVINSISYVLIAFTAVSLVVSSIMIGIITYISVLERTKEIGILRSIGARKKDISRVFNAETLIIGFTAGMFGVVITLLLIIPINLILNHLVEIPHLAALKAYHGIVLVLISMVLTLIAGIIPSRIAAKKDPVEALRSE